MNRTYQHLIGLAFACAAGLSHSGPIIQDQFGTIIQTQFFEPVGQSFTAEDSSVTFSFHIAPINPASTPSDLHFQLLAGDGLGGSVLLQQTITPPAGLDGLIAFDLSAVALSVGNMYTVAMDVPGTSPYWGVDLDQTANPYTGGRAYFTGTSFLPNNPGDDFRFSIIPNGGTVPEPATAALLAAALAGLAWSRRREPMQPV